jgi:hypothetical protein
VLVTQPMKDFSWTQIKNICGMPMLDRGRRSARSSTKSLDGSGAESSCPVMILEKHHFAQASVSHHNKLLLEATKNLAISSARSPSLFLACCHESLCLFLSISLCSLSLSDTLQKLCTQENTVQLKCSRSVYDYDYDEL